MKKIIDSNYLQRDELRDYLDLTTENYVVLTDYAAMEAYKGDTLSSIFKSMTILADYPNQVIVLKDTQTICGLEPKREDLQNRLIDHEQTKSFTGFCRDLADARNGNSSLAMQIIKHGEAANLHMSKMLADTEQVRKAIALIADTYSREELKFLRTNTGITIYGVAGKIFKQVLALAVEIFRTHPRVTMLPDFENLPNSYIFRYSLCSYLLALDWVASGGAKAVKPEKLRNDMVDITFATYATFFDGILSYDKKTNQLYQDACVILDAVFS
jgi:hypothetical protein